MLIFSFFDTQQNEFPINLGTFKIHYFLPKLLESYSNTFAVKELCTNIEHDVVWRLQTGEEELTNDHFRKEAVTLIP